MFTEKFKKSNHHSGTMTLIDVVDENDNVIETKEEHLRDKKKDIIRCSLIFLKDKDGKIILQKRSANGSYPLHWDCSAGGGVDAGESYEAAAQRELREELGISTSLKFLGKELFTYPDGKREFMAVFEGRWDGQCTIDKNEVHSIERFSKEELKALLERKTPVHPECIVAMKKFAGVEDASNFKK